MRSRGAIAAVLLGILTACTSIERPATFLEQVAYAEGAAQAVIKSIGDLSCRKHHPTGECAEPGRPLPAQDALQLLAAASQARQAIRVAASMGPDGAECLGRLRAPNACLAAARSILLQLEAHLRDLQARKS